MTIASAVKDLTISAGIYPYARRLSRVLRPAARHRFEAHKTLLSEFVRPSDLVFDVGANIGSWTEVMLSLGASVVAFEPLPQCAREIAAQNNTRLTVVQKAVGREPGSAALHLHSETTHASLLPNWDERQSPNSIDVEVTTLNEAIANYGVPSFCKIDVEGLEPDVLSGLSTPLSSLSFEYHRDVNGIDRMRSCLSIISQLANYSVSFTRSEEALLIGPWTPAKDFLECQPELAWWGDIFAIRS